MPLPVVKARRTTGQTEVTAYGPLQKPRLNHSFSQPALIQDFQLKEMSISDTPPDFQMTHHYTQPYRKKFCFHVLLKRRQSSSLSAIASESAIPLLGTSGEVRPPGLQELPFVDRKRY
ncbi:hypothetical protein AOLI_G00050510 [Acnodon oligacanthus]